MTKNKGGKGKKAPYKTTVIRVPDPIRGRVEELITEFHSKPVTGIRQIAVEKVQRFYEVTSDPRGFDDCETIYTPTRCWLDDPHPMEEHLDRLEEFLTLGDEINQIIWQFDYGFPGITDNFDEVTGVLRKLIEYQLIIRPYVAPCTTLEYAQWLETLSMDGDVKYSIVSAIESGRWDIVAALYKGQPCDRREYWREYYTNRLGKESLDYWKWAGNPESLEICPELTQLITKLPRPDYEAQRVLDNIGNRINPFHREAAKTQQRGTFISVSFGDQGAFSHYEDKNREALLDAFYNWFELAAALVTEVELKAIFKVCFSCDWSRVEEIIKLYLNGSSPWRVLGIRPGASREDIKAAYKKQTKKHHPDAGGDAARFHVIKAAYDELIQTCYK
ncbi:MAG: J domain-containing protein [Aulosira sp. DedQUE10]|nr:J domain-containing protein [Aulosira sp. DedQUE10]